jgi:PAS domain S-box-containing protein
MGVQEQKTDDIETGQIVMEKPNSILSKKINSTDYEIALKLYNAIADRDPKLVDDCVDIDSGQVSDSMLLICISELLKYSLLISVIMANKQISGLLETFSKLDSEDESINTLLSTQTISKQIRVVKQNNHISSRYGKLIKQIGDQIASPLNSPQFVKYITGLLDPEVLLLPIVDTDLEDISLKSGYPESDIENGYEHDLKILHHSVINAWDSHIFDQISEGSDKGLSLKIRRNAPKDSNASNELDVLTSLNRQIIDSVQSSIMVLGIDGKIEMYNVAAQDLLGQNDLDDKSFHEVMRELDVDLPKNVLSNVIKTGETYQSNNVSGNRAGEPLMINIKLQPYYDKTDALQGILLIMHNITEQRIVEKRLKKSEKSASIGRLSANLAHELGNPLDGILRFLRLLLEQTPDDDPKRKYAEYAQDGVVRVSNMVNGLLDFARRSVSVQSPIDVHKSIEKIILSFSDEISSQGIIVRTEFDEGIPVFLNADLEQIFINIIKNAIQAMPEGGTLSIEAKVPNSDIFEVRFSDTGTGIPREIQETIFEPFFTTKGVGQGVGLGLSICNEIVESYNGFIELESEPGRGTTFTIRIPIGKNGLITMIKSA